MIERKTWEQMSKGERIAGMAILGVIVLVAVLLISSFASAINSQINKSQSSQVVEPVVTYGDVQETEIVRFETVNQDDPTRDIGTSAVTTPGANGVRTKIFQVKYEDDVEVDRTLTKEEVTTQPVTEVTSVGTRTPYMSPVPRASAGSCDPNYSGCVPIDSDVDCGGGSGNGPSYISGAVQVIGSDIYGLDRDGDGWGCE